MEDHKDISDTVGELKWASAFVRLRNASAAREIDRLESVSTFFRGFVLVLAVGCIIFLIRGLWLPFVICGLLAVLSFALFSTRRWKQAELTCLYFIQLSTTPVRIGEAVGALPHSD